MRIALVALLALTVCAYAEQDVDVKTDLNLLQGTWKVLTLEVDGKAQPPEKSPKQITIAGSQLKGIGPEMTIKLDPSKKPKWVDLNFKKGDKDYPIRAIYEVAGDDLTISMPLAIPGQQFENTRPDRLESGKTVALFKAKRNAK